MTHFLPTTNLATAALLVTVLSVCAAPASAQLNDGIPEGAQGVGVDDKLGEQIPLDLRFRDENGRAIALDDIFDGSKPVLLSLNYSDCPMLCGLQLTGLVSALREMPWLAGREYTVVSVSVDPLETTLRAKQTEQKYLKEYGRAGAADGFRFLTGNQKTIRKLAAAIGFRYKYLPDRKEYSHVAAEYVCSPEGVISRCLDDVNYDPQTLRLSLVEASDGKVGSMLDKFFLTCFHYDETKGRYAPTARRLMSLGAGVTIFALAVGLIPYWIHRNATTDGGEDPQGDELLVEDAADPEPASDT